MIWRLFIHRKLYVGEKPMQAGLLPWKLWLLTLTFLKKHIKK